MRDIIYYLAAIAFALLVSVGVVQSDLLPPAQESAAAPQAAPQAAPYTCDCTKTCKVMTCEEAYYQLEQCGCTARDADDDGVPCESVCPGG